MRSKYAALLDASKELKDTKVIMDKHLALTRVNEERYHKQKMDFEDLTAAHNNKIQENKDKEMLVKDIQTKIQRYKEEKDRIIQSFKDRKFELEQEQNKIDNTKKQAAFEITLLQKKVAQLQAERDAIKSKLNKIKTKKNYDAT